MPSQNPNQELFTIGPFGGLDLTTSPFYVKAPNFIDMQNVVPNRQYIGYSTVQGRVQAFNYLPSAVSPWAIYPGTLVPLLDGAGWAITAIFQFNGTFAPYITTPQQVYIIMYTITSTGQIALAVWAPQTPAMPITLIFGPNEILQGTGAYGGALASFMYTAATQNRWLFIGGIRINADGTSNGFAPTIYQPLKVDTTNMVVSYWGLTATAVGATGIAYAPHAASSGAGALNGQYNYCITASTPYQESSQGTISNTVTVANQSVNLNFGIFQDPQVTARNIYRIGGSLSQWQLVATVDNTTNYTTLGVGATNYNDNLADSAVVGQTLIYNRDPPQGFFSVFQHKERIWGFGYAAQPSDLWYSNYNEPWGFNNGATSPGVLFCGRNTNNDQAVAGCSIGSVAVLFKRKTTWVVYGDSASDFLVRKLFDMGCVAPRSVVSAYGVAFWLSRQGAYIFDGNSPTNISDGNPETGGIKAFLTNPQYAGDLTQAVGFVFDRIYYLSFPTLNITFGYDIRSGTWHRLGFSTSACNPYSDPENSPYPVLAGRNGAAYALDQWFGAETDLQNPIANYVTSGISDSGAPAATKTYMYAYLEAPLQTGVTATVTFIVDPFDVAVGASTGRSQTFVQTIALSSGPTRHWFSLPKTLVGNMMQVQVALSSTTPANLVVWRVGVYGQIKRLNSPEGDA